jgi:NAD(P)-dependent dehydrogenase (short-subunit alcohol dehydrogenase family)
MSRVWFVTGSSRGLGRAIVEAALAAGDRVAATARRPAELADLVARYGDQVRAIALDVTSYDATVAAVAEAVVAFGRIDVVVNNAGYADTAAIEDMRLDNFRAQIDTNFYGVVHVTKAVVPILREQGGGRIFQVSSIGDRFGTPGLSAYQSAKWAIVGFSTVLAQETAPFGIKVTVLEPGGMKTDWAGSSMDIPEISEPYKSTVGAFATFIRKFSGNEPTEPAAVARLVLQLADHEEPPLRLLVGADAAQYGRQAVEALAASDENWREVSMAVSVTPTGVAGSPTDAVLEGRPIPGVTVAS